jgi:small ligand-binding sensory domain FIST
MTPPGEDAFGFASAFSDQSETNTALNETLHKLGSGPFDVIFCFATYHHRDQFEQITRRLNHTLQPKALLGLTAAGVIGSGRETDGESGLSLLAARWPGVSVRPIDADALANHDPTELADALAVDGKSPTGLLLFVDPFTTPLVRLLPALNAAIPGTPIVGGLASGGADPGSNRLILNNRVLAEGLVGVSVGAGLQMDCTVSQGCRPIGRPLLITKARNNLIQELGRKPVMDVIQELTAKMTDKDRELLEQGLFVGRVIDEYRDGFERGDFLVRNIIGVDQDSGYIAVNDLIRVGQTIQFHVRDAETAEEDLRMLLEQQKAKGGARGALLCTCNGRGTNLFETSNMESTLIDQMLGPVPMAGFFAGGEIGPIGGENFIHGFTASLAVFRPSEISP